MMSFCWGEVLANTISVWYLSRSSRYSGLMSFRSDPCTTQALASLHTHTHTHTHARTHTHTHTHTHTQPAPGLCVGRCCGNTHFKPCDLKHPVTYTHTHTFTSVSLYSGASPALA